MMIINKAITYIALHTKLSTKIEVPTDLKRNIEDFI